VFPLYVTGAMRFANDVMLRNSLRTALRARADIYIIALRLRTSDVSAPPVKLITVCACANNTEYVYTHICIPLGNTHTLALHTPTVCGGAPLFSAAQPNT
jgi:hypothetical protein